MSEEKPDISLTTSGTFKLTSLDEAWRFAVMVSVSGMAPKDYSGKQNAGKVVVAMQMGAEIGLSPMAALQNIAVINGRPSIYGDALLAVALKHPDCVDIIETFDAKAMTATCLVKRKGKEDLVRTFSVDDAKLAGLWGKPGPWKQYPPRMLQMRARGFALRDAFADALRGVSIREEQEDIITAARDVTDRPKEKGAAGLISRLEAMEPEVVPAPTDDDNYGEVVT